MSLFSFCIAPGCIKYKHYQNGMCPMHYQRWNRYLSFDIPEKTIQPPSCKKHGILTKKQLAPRKTGSGWSCKACKDDSRKKDWGDATELKCTTCKQSKIIDEFHKCERTSCSPRCKKCRGIYRKTFRSAHYIHIRTQDKEYKSKPEYKRKAKIAARKLRLAVRFGLTEAQYNEIYESQNGLCAICLKPETAFDTRLNVTKRLAVDHCHKKNKIRALLCSKCNRGIGFFNDNITTMLQAIEYLKAHY